jgi:hypothetical protein
MQVISFSSRNDMGSNNPNGAKMPSRHHFAAEKNNKMINNAAPEVAPLPLSALLLPGFLKSLGKLNKPALRNLSDATATTVASDDSYYNEQQKYAPEDLLFLCCDETTMMMMTSNEDRDSFYTVSEEGKTGGEAQERLVPVQLRPSSASSQIPSSKTNHNHKHHELPSESLFLALEQLNEQHGTCSSSSTAGATTKPSNGIPRNQRKDKHKDCFLDDSLRLVRAPRRASRRTSTKRPDAVFQPAPLTDTLNKNERPNQQASSPELSLEVLVSVEEKRGVLLSSSSSSSTTTPTSVSTTSPLKKDGPSNREDCFLNDSLRLDRDPRRSMRSIYAR